jgi:hypothetical protein
MYYLEIKTNQGAMFLTTQGEFMPESLNIDFAEFVSVDEAAQRARQLLTNDEPCIAIVDGDFELILKVSL